MFIQGIKKRGGNGLNNKGQYDYKVDYHGNWRKLMLLLILFFDISLFIVYFLIVTKYDFYFDRYHWHINIF